MCSEQEHGPRARRTGLWRIASASSRNQDQFDGSTFEFSHIRSLWRITRFLLYPFIRPIWHFLTQLMQYVDVNGFGKVEQLRQSVEDLHAQLVLDVVEHPPHHFA